MKGLHHQVSKIKGLENWNLWRKLCFFTVARDSFSHLVSSQLSNANHCFLSKNNFISEKLVEGTRGRPKRKRIKEED